MKARITVYLTSPDSKQRRPYYSLQWEDPDTRRRKTRSTKTGNLTEAEVIRADWECRLNEGRLELDQGKLAWQEFRRRFREDHLEHLRRNTRSKYTTVLNRLEEMVSLRTLGQVDEDLLQKHANWLKARGYKPVSIACHLTHLHAALAWAAGKKLIPRVPQCPSIKVPRKLTIRRITEEEWGRLIGACADPTFRDLLWTAWHTGLRRSELWALSWASPGVDPGGEQRPLPWVDFERQRIVLPAEYCKAGRDDWVPIHQDLLPLLACRRQQIGLCFPISDSASSCITRLNKLFAQLRDRAGVQGVELHDIRKTFGCRYAAVVPAQRLQRLMRHASLTTTLKYYVDQDLGLDDSINLL